MVSSELVMFCLFGDQWMELLRAWILLRIKSSMYLIFLCCLGTDGNN